MNGTPCGAPLAGPRLPPPRAAIAVGTLALVLLAMTGCARTEATRRVTLRVLNWAPELELQLEQRIARGFEATHPHVSVVVESVVNNYGEKLAVAIASGTPPDVFLLDVPDIPAFVDRGLVLDLSPYLSRVGYDRAAVFPQVLDVFARGPRLHALPKDFTPMAIYVNRRVFDAAGVSPPGEADWTWDEFLAASLAVSRDTDADGVRDVVAIDFPRDLYKWVPWVWSAGGDILGPGGTRASGYLDGPAAIDTFRFLTDLVVRHQVTPPVQFTLGGDMARTSRFFTGRQAMMLSGHWSMPLLLDYAARGDIDLSLAPIPHRTGATPATAIYVSGWAVPANVRHKRLAVELAAWLAGEAAQRERGDTRLGIPALRHVADELAARDTTGIERAFLRQVDRGRMPWGAVVRDFHRVERLSFDIMDRRLLRGEDVAAVAREIAARLDEELAR